MGDQHCPSCTRGDGEQAMTGDIAARILAAATLAEQAAARAGQDWQAHFTVHGDPMLVPRDRPWASSRIADVSTSPADYGRANCILLGASGPSHWGAVAELLREVARVHSDGHECPGGDSADQFTGFYRTDSDGDLETCPTVAALLPLADQIIRDLGDQLADG